jgi:hypothetical protein
VIEIVGHLRDNGPRVHPPPPAGHYAGACCERTALHRRPIPTDGALRRVVGALGGWTVPSRHLWAVAWK